MSPQNQRLNILVFQIDHYVKLNIKNTFRFLVMQNYLKTQQRYKKIMLLTFYMNV